MRRCCNPFKSKHYSVRNLHNLRKVSETNIDHADALNIELHETDFICTKCRNVLKIRFDMMKSSASKQVSRENNSNDFKICCNPFLLPHDKPNICIRKITNMNLRQAENVHVILSRQDYICSNCRYILQERNNARGTDSNLPSSEPAEQETDSDEDPSELFDSCRNEIIGGINLKI